MNKLKDRIEAWAQEVNANLVATDPRFNRSVKILHRDGSYLDFEDAFIECWPHTHPGFEKTRFLVVFTEHHGFLWYDVDDLDFAREIGPGGRGFFVEPDREEKCCGTCKWWTDKKHCKLMSSGSKESRATAFDLVSDFHPVAVKTEWNFSCNQWEENEETTSDASGD